LREIDPDLAWPVEVVVHEHDLGGARRAPSGYRGSDPVTVDAERRAAGTALRDGPGPVAPGVTVVHRLPHVGLQRSHAALASGQVAEIDRVRLVGGQAVV